MDTKWKHRIAYGITIAIGLVGIYLTIKLAAKPQVQAVPTSNSNSQPGGTQVGSPAINIIGGTYPLTWNNDYTSLPTDPNGTTGNTTQLYLPVISNYNTTQNGGCGSCAGSAPDAYYASSIAANEYITAAMMKELGYTKAQNGQVYKPGYYNLGAQTSTEIQSFFDGL